MARTWLAIQVELVGGRGAALWPRPGRIVAAAPTHTFEQLAGAIDDAFARWDRSHLNEFTLADGTPIGDTEPELDPPDDMLDASRESLARLEPGEQLAYVFDLGDEWTHLCTVVPEPLDPEEVFEDEPTDPVAIFGWGSIPDQYGLRWQDDDGEGPVPPDPHGSDLPDFLSHWRH